MTQPSARIARNVLFVAAIPTLILLDTAVAVARGWRPSSWSDRGGIWLAVMCLLVLAATVAIPGGRRFLARIGTKLGVLMVSLTIGWAIADVALAVFVAPRLYDSLHLYSPGLRRLFQPAPGVMPGVEGDSRFTTNEIGLRAPSMPPRAAAFRILCIGGSTTICAYLDDEETWPSLLMRELNADPNAGATWIGNVGFSGHTSANHLDFVTGSKLIDEMDCVIILVGVNDLVHALLGTDDEPADDPAQLSPPVWRRSLILELARRRWKRMREASTIWVEDVAGASYQDRRRRRQAAVEVAELPDLTGALSDYEARLRAIVATLQRKGLRLVFANQPTMWSAAISERSKALLWLGEVEGERFAAPAPLAAGMARFNESLLKVCNETGTRCIDLRGMNGREDLYYDDCHFNEAGAREVARLIAAQADALR